MACVRAGQIGGHDAQAGLRIGLQLFLRPGDCGMAFSQVVGAGLMRHAARAARRSSWRSTVQPRARNAANNCSSSGVKRSKPASTMCCGRLP